MSFLGFVEKAKGLVDKAGGSDGIKESFNKANDSDMVVSAKSAISINHTLRRIEINLKNVDAEDINISASVKSELGEFIQKGLVAMGHNITVDGMAGAGTVAALNTALLDKVESVGWTDLDKLKDVKEIDDITKLTGRHVQVFVDELRERDILDSGTPEMLVELGQALRDIDNDTLKGLADDIDPKVEPAPAPVEATSDITTEIAPAR